VLRLTGSGPAIGNASTCKAAEKITKTHERAEMSRIDEILTSAYQAATAKFAMKIDSRIDK
jgi:hypothetical protein